MKKEGQNSITPQNSNMKYLTSILHRNRYFLYYVLAVVYLGGLFTFFAYYNFNLFPEKERSLFTIKIYYQSGRRDTKTFDLPKSTHFSLINNNSRSNLTSIWYYNEKPFGKERGYLIMGVEDYEIVGVK
jgi:hypothetical protein